MKLINKKNEEKQLFNSIFIDYELYLKNTSLHKYLREMVVDYLFDVYLEQLKECEEVFDDIKMYDDYKNLNFMDNIKKLYYLLYEKGGCNSMRKCIIVAKLKNIKGDKYIYFDYCIDIDGWCPEADINFYMEDTLKELGEKINCNGVKSILN
jgi:hypothetical protein